MLTLPIVGSFFLILLVSALLAVSGLKKQPGLGILGALVIIGLAFWLRRQNLADLGLAAPPGWLPTILLGLLLGAIIQLLSVALIEPVAEQITGIPHDLSLLAGVKGNWKALVGWLLLVWILVAFIEEGIFRGFLMTEINRLLGGAPLSLAFNILFSSLVFGMAHGYQNRSGMLSTGFAGLLLAVLFVLSDFNLWLVIFTHGFIDTLGIALIATGQDQVIREWVWN